MSRQPLAQQHIILLLTQHHHLSAPELVEHLSQQGQPVNKTTVYRALEKLLADGVICRCDLGSDVPQFELRHHHHDHAVCENCGTVELIDCHTPSPEPAQIHGFVVDHHHATFFGRCFSCQQGEKTV